MLSTVCSDDAVLDDVFVVIDRFTAHDTAEAAPLPNLALQGRELVVSRRSTAARVEPDAGQAGRNTPGRLGVQAGYRAVLEHTFAASAHVRVERAKGIEPA